MLGKAPLAWRWRGGVRNRTFPNQRRVEKVLGPTSTTSMVMVTDAKLVIGSGAASASTCSWFLTSSETSDCFRLDHKELQLGLAHHVRRRG